MTKLFEKQLNLVYNEANNGITEYENDICPPSIEEKIIKNVNQEKNYKYFAFSKGISTKKWVEKNGYKANFICANSVTLTSPKINERKIFRI